MYNVYKGLIMDKSKKTQKKSIKKPVEQIHGKSETNEDEVASKVKLAKDLNHILGLNKKNPFGTDSEVQLIESLSSMNLTDMRELAVSAGIFPSGNRTVLKKKILKGFSSYSRGSSGEVRSIPVNNSRAPDSELQKKINSIWDKR